MTSIEIKSRPSVELITIDGGQAGQRLDNFLLTRLKGVPKSHIYRLVRRGEVRVNKSRAKPHTRLCDGDMVRIPPVRIASRTGRFVLTEKLKQLSNRTLYEDDHLLAIDKPAGVAVHSGSGIQTGLIEAMRLSRNDLDFLELGHRLDRETSGCLLLAKSRPAMLALHAAFRHKTIEPNTPVPDEAVKKCYTALLCGRWHGGKRVIEIGISRVTQGTQSRQQTDADGRRSRSVFKPIKTYKNHALVEINLETGRTHQARVHAAHIDLPIAGDAKYGYADANKLLLNIGLKRLFLHAATLNLHHPITSKRMTITSPLPDELQIVLKQLENG